MGVAVGDYLHTGRLSLLLSHFDNEYAALYRNDSGLNNGGVNFADLSIARALPEARKAMSGGETPSSTSPNNGWEDFFLVNGHVYPQVDSAHTAARYLEAKLLFVNEKDGTSGTPANWWRRDSDPAGEPRAWLWGIFSTMKDGSGYRNLWAADDSPSRRGGRRNHWVSFQLEGVGKSNRLP